MTILITSFNISRMLCIRSVLCKNIRSYIPSLRLSKPIFPENKSLFSDAHDKFAFRLPVRCFTDSSNSPEPPTDPSKTQAPTLVQRFKNAYAIYGKVVIITHGLTSCFWFGSFYYLASSGINLLEVLQNLNAPEWMSKPLRLGGGSVNTWATALVLYKLAAPARYGLTLLITTYMVRYLRLTGKAPKVEDQDRLRNLARESAQISRERLKTRITKGKKSLSRKQKRYL